MRVGWLERHPDGWHWVRHYYGRICPVCAWPQRRGLRFVRSHRPGCPEA